MNKKTTKDIFGKYLYDESNDPIKTDTFLLMNNYKLIVFPNNVEEYDNRINCL